MEITVAEITNIDKGDPVVLFNIVGLSQSDVEVEIQLDRKTLNQNVESWIFSAHAMLIERLDTITRIAKNRIHGRTV